MDLGHEVSEDEELMDQLRLRANRCLAPAFFPQFPQTQPYCLNLLSIFTQRVIL